MNIKFNSLQLNNFFSYQDARIDFDKTGYTVVVGTNNNVDDNAKSNGSGKSAIWEGITWVLTGSTIRGTKDVKNYYLDGVCKVSLDFNIGSDNYVVTRSKDPSNLTIVINGVDKSGKGIRDTETLLREYLPDLTAELIGSVIILGQGLPARFSNNSPSGRKDVLEKLSKSDFMIQDLKVRINKRQEELLRDINQCKLDDTAYSTKIEVNSKNIAMYQSIIDSTSKPSDEYLEKVSTDLQVAKDKLSKLEVGLSSVQIELSELLQDKSKVESNKVLEKASIQDLYRDEITELTTKKNALLSEKALKEKELVRLSKITDTCPTCGQKLQGVQLPDLTSNKKEIESLNNDISVLSESCQAKSLELNQRLTEVDNKFRSIIAESESSFVSKKQEESQFVSEIRKAQSEVESLTSIVGKLKAEIESYDAKMEEYKKIISEAQDESKDLEQKLLYNNKKNENYQNHLEVIKKFDTLIKRDFRGYLLSNVIKFIDDVAKRYSLEVFGTDKINFKLDGNNISISYCDKEYENLSGGERCRCDIIIQLAIRKMLCTYLNFSSNILCVDEVFDSLDSVGCEKITSLLFTQLPDVENVYIITHRADLPISCDNELIIVKDENGISHVGE